MPKHNATNERIKRRYAEYLAEAKRQSPASVDKALAAIDRFQDDTKRRDFAKFRTDQAVAFKRRFLAEINPATGRPLAKATVNATLKALRAFFIWLAEQPGYRRTITYSHADFFNASNRDARLARSGTERPSPSPEQVQHVIGKMPATTPLERRDRAILAFLFLTGIRDGAAIGLKLRHVDLVARTIRQDAREVAVKFAKSQTTSFFPVGDDVEDIFAGYVRFLREDLLRSPDDSLFPKTAVATNAEGAFEVVGLKREHWSSAAPIRGIVQRAFAAEEMPGYGPHSFRKTLARLGQQVCKTFEEMKVWSQNLGHEDVMTTLRSYGQVSPDRQLEVMAKLRAGKVELSTDSVTR